MKVIHLAFTANGGAGIAAARSVQALLKCGVNAEFWTVDGSGASPPLRFRRWSGRRIWLDGLPLSRYRARNFFSAWSNNWLPSRLAPRVNRAKPDLVHLHWIGSGFLSPREFERFSSPVAWTLHDAWAVTGGCHYPSDCDRYTAACGECPQLGSSDPDDLSRRNLRAMRSSLRWISAFVSPSRWLAQVAIASGGVPPDRMHVIPYGLDCGEYSVADQTQAREALGIRERDLVVVAGAQNLQEPRKGFSLLRETLARLVASTAQRCVLVMFGANAPEPEAGWPCEVRQLGFLRGSAALARTYAAADLLLLPSLQDNFPNQALEAQACGCPVVGFDAGGLGEIIVPGLTGALADETTASGLAAAAQSWLATGRDRAKVSKDCRSRCERQYTLAEHGRCLTDLYAKLLNDRPETPWSLDAFQQK